MNDDLERSGMTKTNVIEVAQIFNRHEIEYWLIGGWAIDFVLEIESQHKDMDFLVADNQKVKTHSALESIGFRKLGDSTDWENGNDFLKRDELLIDLAPIRVTDVPRLIGEYSTLEFPKNLLETKFLDVEGTRVKTLSPEMHIAIKHSIGSAFEGLREKDILEIQLLKNHMRNRHVQ